MSIGLGTIYAEVALRLDKLDQGMREAESKIREAEKRFEGFEQAGKRMSDMGKQWTMKVTAPIVAAGVAIFKTGMDFEENMSKIVGLVGVAQDQVDEWGKDILQLAPQLGKAPKELADGLFFVTSAGFRGAEAMDVLEIAAKGSAAGLGETAMVADALTSAINAYGSENLDATKAADILTAAVREGKMEASALAPVLGSLLPTSSALGIGFDQVAGTLAVMSRTGLSAAEGATSLNAIMGTLLKPTEGAKKALDEYGLSMADLRSIAAQGPDGLVNVMRLLETTFEDNEEALAQVIPNVRAFRGAMNILAQDADIVDDVMRGVNESTGALTHGFETASDTAKFKWDATVAQLQATLISFSGVLKEALVPVLEKLTNILAKVAEWFGNLSPGMQKAILVFIGIVAAIGPVLMFLGMLFGAIAKIAAFMPILKGALLLLKGGLLLLASPIGIIVAALVALIAIGVLVYRNWETIKEKATEIWGSITDFFSNTWENIKAIFDKALAFVLDLFFKYHPLGWIISNWDEIKAFFSRTWESIKKDFSDALTAIYNFIKEKFDGARKYIIDIWNAIKDFLLKLWENLRIAVIQKAEALRKGVIDTIDRALKWIRELPRKALQWGRDIIQGLINGIKNMAGNISGAIRGVVNSAVTSAKNFLGIKSPSKLFEEIGSNVGLGMEKGILDARRAVKLAMAELSSPAVSIAGSGAMGMGSGIVQHNHGGTIRIEGVTDRGQFIDAVEVVLDRLRQEVR